MNKPRYNENNIKTDCFGYCRIDTSTPPKCTALDGLYCATGECKFYKSKEENDKLEKIYGGLKTQKILKSKNV